MTLVKSNTHIDVGVLSAHLREYSPCVESIGKPCLIEVLGALKQGADNTTKALIRNATGAPQAVVVCSRTAAPGLVARGVERAEAVRQVLGERLGSAIIRPIETGIIDGRTYAIFPWCRDIPASRVFRRVVLAWLRRRLLDWLHDATVAAVARRDCEPPATGAYDGRLDHLSRQPFVNATTRNLIRQAREHLDRQRWQPRHAADHNDLWHGNLMRPARGTRAAMWPFVIIDWAGANCRGFGIYDLLRLAISLRMTPQALARELERHAVALRCGIRDLPGHYLASMGYLHEHIECFPFDQYVRTFNSCWDTLSRALVLLPAPSDSAPAW